ncbi:MAG: dihydrolipoyl dehydrogenase [Lachnospiraceae bacterium]|nr:dihydrolipoyl dehydrogenase [Lachnospiraceae bacterium]
MEQFDILVIGAGPGGYSLAIAAAKKGLKVAVFEKEHIGGTCLNVGCIPTKYLVDKAATMEKVRALCSKEIFRDAGSFSFKKIIAGKDEVVGKLTGGISFLLKKTGCEVVSGEAVLKPDRVVECAGRTFQGKNIVIATGAETMIIPIPGHELCIDSTQALKLTSLPRSMVVMGGGVIGLELACAFAAYGTEVTIVEMLPEIMGREEKAAVRIVLRSMEALGITVKTSAKMLRVEKDGVLLKAVYKTESGEESSVCEQVLMAVGRKAHLPGIDAQALGLELDAKKCVRVDSRQRTNLEGVYAIGDAAGGLQLAHAAYAEGEKALADILDEEHTDKVPVPVCTYTIPCFARVGLTSKEAREAGYVPALGTFDYGANGMALAEGATGCVFVVADKATTRTLGVTIVGENASELIAFASLAVAEGLTAKQWEAMIVAHPSLSEAIREAALDCFRRSVHKG